MTRILEAFSKARSTRPVPGPAPVHAPPLIAAVPAPERATRPAMEPSPAWVEEARRLLVPFGGSPELPADVLREMAGLRISLEVALTQRIPRTVMFLASQGGEGTSTVAAQFAQVLANDDRLRVLLVDAHVRRPAYGLDGAPVAAGREDTAARWRAQSRPGGPDLLPLSSAAQEDRVITAESLRQALDALASGYDWIVIDGPPVLESPDAASLGAVAEGVIVVVQAGRTKRPVLARSVDLMNRAGGRVLGIVLNRRRLEIPEFIYRRI
jgi:Mrp family chromosome partitioning ATPase